MKSTTCIVTAVLVCVAVFVCSGQGSEKVTVQDMGSGIFKLSYVSPSPATVKVAIQKSNGATVFSESLTKVSSFSRPYNFSSQGPGDYKFVVEDKDGRTEQPISYTVKKVESLVEVIPIANEPGKYLLSVDNKESDQLKVVIKDHKGILREESLFVSGRFSVVYNLKVKTTPTFEITGSSGNTKTFTF